MRTTTVTFEDEDYQALKVLAAARGVTLGDIVREGLSGHVAEGRLLVAALKPQSSAKAS